MIKKNNNKKVVKTERKNIMSIKKKLKLLIKFKV